jgi:hypothetical protein
VTVVAVTATRDGFECIVKSPTRGLVEAFLRRSQLAEVKVTAHDGGGDAGRALTAVWARWMAWSVPRIRSAVLGVPMTAVSSRPTLPTALIAATDPCTQAPLTVTAAGQRLSRGS